MSVIVAYFFSSEKYRIPPGILRTNHSFRATYIHVLFLHYCLHTAHNITINGHSRMLIQLYQQESNILLTILFMDMPGINNLTLVLALFGCG